MGSVGPLRSGAPWRARVEFQSSAYPKSMGVSGSRTREAVRQPPARGGADEMVHAGRRRVLRDAVDGHPERSRSLQRPSRAEPVRGRPRAMLPLGHGGRSRVRSLESERSTTISERSIETTRGSIAEVRAVVPGVRDVERRRPSDRRSGTEGSNAVARAVLAGVRGVDRLGPGDQAARPSDRPSSSKGSIADVRAAKSKSPCARHPHSSPRSSFEHGRGRA